MRLLMCPPSYYGIKYEINPWMRCSRPSNYPLAQKQWRALYRLLRDRLNIDVCLIEPKRGLPDMVFTANAGFVWEKKFIVSNFRYDVRRGEASHFEKWFAGRNYEVVKLPEQNFFEGEGDLLMCADVMFAGYPIRSCTNSHRRIADIIQQQVLSLKLTSDWFYHLDTCFCPLSRSEAIYYPAAFDAEALHILQSRVRTLIPVADDEARRFACNAIVVEKNLVMNDGCPKIREQLESLGFHVFEIPLAEFIKSGGSAKCLVLKIPHCE
jgi:N-dimethylarginine dimethylaminohydrolase